MRLSNNSFFHIRLSIPLLWYDQVPGDQFTTEGLITPLLLELSSTTPTAWTPWHGSCRFRRTPFLRAATATAAAAPRPCSLPSSCEAPFAAVDQTTSPSRSPHEPSVGTRTLMSGRRPPVPSRGALTLKSSSSPQDNSGRTTAIRTANLPRGNARRTTADRSASSPRGIARRMTAPREPRR